MKGIIFNLLEEAVSKEFGDATWDHLLDEANLSGAYTSIGNYADGEIVALFDAASKALNKSPQDILRWFGHRSIPSMAASYPDFFNSHVEARSFLLSLNSIIHLEVHKLYPGASTPVFDFAAIDDGGLAIGYRSPRKLCALAEGFIEGAAEHFHEQIEISHLECMHECASKCLFHVRFNH
jgi:predicted hydrocarbon binding protein